MIVYILAELTFELQYIELITTISSPLHNDWPIVQKSYLTLTKRLISSQSSFLRYIVSKQKFLLIKILLPLFLYVLKYFLLLLVRQKLANDSSWFIAARLSFWAICSLYVNVFEVQLFFKNILNFAFTLLPSFTFPFSNTTNP